MELGHEEVDGVSSVHRRVTEQVCNPALVVTMQPIHIRFGVWIYIFGPVRFKFGQLDPSPDKVANGTGPAPWRTLKAGDIATCKHAPIVTVALAIYQLVVICRSAALRRAEASRGRAPARAGQAAC